MHVRGALTREGLCPHTLASNDKPLKTMKRLTINADGKHIELTADSDLLDAQADSDSLDSILTAGRDHGHVHLSLYEDGTYSADVVVLDGQHRDTRAETRIESAIDDAIGRPKRSASEQTGDAISNLKDALQ